MAGIRSLLALIASIGLATASECPFGHTSAHTESLEKRAPEGVQGVESLISPFVVNETDGAFMTSDVGGPIEDQNSLKAGDRGPTLLEDFIFRQKITHFDHERVPERAVHARGAGAHGVFESYGDFSNITAASFLNAPGKRTPVFVRFSTVAGSRGSADTARDVHGFATRFYTDEGNFDIVGNNIPVFFIQDAIRFPDLIHAVKPQQDREMPQAATAHDTAWDFFSQEPSTLHTLFWAMSGQGIVRSYRHMDGFGVHTFRFVNNDGRSKLVKFHFKTLQGKAGLVWEEAQEISGKNSDYHRQDLWESIEQGHFPEWEFGVQVMDEADEHRFGFDLMDPTKFVPEELVPITKLGKLTLNRNPTNYFAEVEQVMFQPGHLVRGIDFSEDHLLQGRIFSYLDTQLNRHGNPNFEQLPINRPAVPVHNNNRDGAGQMMVHANNAAYTPNTLNRGGPRQASRSEGKGFFTAPGRRVEGHLHRTLSRSLDSDHWSQPRLFFNSLVPKEQQFLINAIRFETAHLTREHVKRNVLNTLNKVDHRIARQVAETLGMSAPEPDPTFYHQNRTINIGVFGQELHRLNGLKVGVLTTDRAIDVRTIEALKSELTREGVKVVVVAERLQPGVDVTYSMSDATDFDAVVVASGSGPLFANALKVRSALYPAGRPTQILQDAYRFGKPIAFAGDSNVDALEFARIPRGPGVFFETDPIPPQGRLVNDTGAATVKPFANKTTTLEKPLRKRALNSTIALNSTSVQQGIEGSEGQEESAAPEAPGDIARHIRRGLREFRYLDRFHME